MGCYTGFGGFVGFVLEKGVLVKGVLVGGVADFGTVSFGSNWSSKNLFALNFENYEFAGNDCVAATVEKVVRVENFVQNKFAVVGTD